MHQLVALVNAKLSPTNGAFASLTEICLAHLSVDFNDNPWRRPNQLGFDPWLGDLRGICEKAKVKLHTKQETMYGPHGPSEDSYPCSFCQPHEIHVDSAPVIPEEDQSNGR